MKYLSILKKSWVLMVAVAFAFTMFSTWSFHESVRAYHAPAVHALSGPREYLKIRTEEEGIPYQTLNAIIECESRWLMVKNSVSTAFGYFQILDGTERTTPQYKQGLRKFDPYVNIDMGISLYLKRGTNPWNESRKCWKWRV